MNHTLRLKTIFFQSAMRHTAWAEWNHRLSATPVETNRHEETHAALRPAMEAARAKSVAPGVGACGAAASSMVDVGLAPLAERPAAECAEPIINAGEDVMARSAESEEFPLGGGDKGSGGDDLGAGSGSECYDARKRRRKRSRTSFTGSDASGKQVRIQWDFESAEQANAIKCLLADEWKAIKREGIPSSVDGVHEGKHDCEKRMVRHAPSPRSLEISKCSPELFSAHALFLAVGSTPRARHL